MKVILIILTFVCYFKAIGQEKGDDELLWSNPYLAQSDTNFSLDTIPVRIQGQVLDYSNNPFPLIFVTLEDKTGSKTIHYCDSRGQFFIPKNILNQSVAYVKVGCCSSDTHKVDLNTDELIIKYQGGTDCLKKKSYSSCNPIIENQYYVNYMVTDVTYYEVQLGSEILNLESVEVMFYVLIEPKSTYKNDLNEKFLGETLIQRKKLLFTDWNDKLFNKE